MKDVAIKEIQDQIRFYQGKIDPKWPSKDDSYYEGVIFGLEQSLISIKGA